MTRIQLSRQSGWRIPPGTQKCDRSTALGNPFRSEGRLTPVKCIRLFRLWAEAALEFPDGYLSAEQKDFRAAFLKLEESPPEHLACWCARSSKCHVDEIIHLLAIRRASREQPSLHADTANDPAEPAGREGGVGGLGAEHREDAAQVATAAAG